MSSERYTQPHTVIHMLAEGDMVATHWSITGTHHQPYRGAAPSAQRLTWEGVTLHRVADGQRLWVQFQ